LSSTATNGWSTSSRWATCGWLRLDPDGCQDRGAFGGPASGDIMPRLIEWLLDGRDPGLDQASGAMTARSIKAGRLI
jgi:hypothetical protein